MTSYTNALTGGLIQPSNMSYGAYSFAEDLVLSWPSSFSNNPKITASIMDLTAEEDGLSVILPDARSVSVGQNILLNNRGKKAFVVQVRYADGALGKLLTLTTGQSFYIYLTDNSKPQGSWNVIPFGAGSVVVTSVGAKSEDEKALTIDGSPITGAGTFLFKLSETLKAFSAFTKKGLAVLTEKGWEGRSLQAGKNIALKDGDGAKGDPVIATTEDVAFKNAGIETLTLKSLVSGVPEGKKQPVPVTALQTKGQTAFLTGWDENYAVKEVTYGAKGVDNWKLPTQTKERGEISLYGLSEIINAQAQGSLDILSKITPPKNACIIGGTTSEGGSFYEMLLKEWQIPTLRPSNNGPTGVDFSTLWDAQANDSLSGTKLKKNSVPLQVLENPGQCAPFAMGWVGANGKLYTGFNVKPIERSKTGQYYITFETPASSAVYVVLVTPYHDPKQIVYIEPQIVSASYFSVFCTGQKEDEFVDNSFCFGVWDLGLANSVSVS
ncbi:hypothetical protein Cva_00747 [Caedimonas varicaedens]|uniref:Uncharacterized protein n=1 Tax=Caedimonas varicaedens TaxID=1629334 RepID=A0A0K8ME10_9PROT|nr:hypothetical protein Cva_00747 [Caedimonas varicaedens]